MKRYLIVILFLSLFANVYSQHAKVESNRVVSQTVKSTRSGSVKLLGTMGDKPLDTEWKNKLISLRIDHDVPNEEALKEAIEKATKEQLTAPKQRGESPKAQSRAVIDPDILRGFKANQQTVLTPPDNSMAISKDGIIVSCDNSVIEYYRENGTRLYTGGYADLLAGNGLDKILFDPRVLYDSQSDRFIFVILHGTWANVSKVVVCFSKTPNPVDGWNLYTLDGDALNDGAWFDYPKIAVSNNDFFVTGNLFKDNGGGFTKAIVYQCDKNDGYSGRNLDFKLWGNVPGGPFTLQPVRYGQEGNYGPGLYFISNHSGGGSEIKLFELTDHLGVEDAVIKYSKVPTDWYGPPGRANQQGSDQLKNGDCRMQDAFYLDGIIHFVFQTSSNGFSAVRYNRMDLEAATIEHTTKSYSSKYSYSYPVLASISSNPYDRSVAVGFLYSGSEAYPGVRAAICNHDMEWSNSKNVKVGSAFVDFQSGVDRWGDYSGMMRKPGSDPVRVWMAGCYGGTNTYDPNYWCTWVNEIGITGSAPSAAFSANKLQVQAGEEVTFTNSSSAATAYRWEFQGAAMSDSREENPTVTYTTPGVYAVRLIAYNAFGEDIETRAGYITVEGEVSTFPELCMPLDENADDLSGNENHGTVLSGVSFFNDWERGMVGKFDKQNYIEIAQGDPFSMNLPGKEMTVSAWVKVEQIDDWGGFVSYVQDNGSYEKGWILGTRGNRFSFALASDGGSGLTYLIDTMTFEKEKWYHVAGTYDGSEMKLYINGTLHGVSTAQSGGIAYPESAWWVVGSFKDSDENVAMDGRMDEVKMYTRTLSSSEIALLAQDKLGCSEVVADFEANERIIYQGESVQFTDKTLNQPEVWAWTFEGADQSNSFEQNPIITYSEVGLYDVTLQVSGASSNDDITKMDYIRVLPQPEHMPIACYPLAGNTNDYSGNGNNATQLGGSFENDNERGEVFASNGEGAARIDSGETVSMNVPLMEMTASAWVYVDETMDWGGVVGCVQDNGSDEKGWLLGMREHQFSFALASQGDPNKRLKYLKSPQAVSTGQWYHLAATYDGDKMNLYVNGQLASSSEDQSGLINYSTAAWYGIGSFKDDDSDIRFNGKISAVRLWERALDDQEVLDQYQSNENCLNLVANFTSDETEGDIPLTVNFEDVSSGTYDSRKWIFEGGNPAESTLDSPQVVYQDSGTYDVTLIVTKGNISDTLKREDYIHAIQGEAPVAAFEADLTIGPKPLTVQFSDLSMEEPTSWKWAFEGGSPASSEEQNPVVQYDKVGLYDVKLVVTNKWGQDSLIKTDYIEVTTLTGAGELPDSELLVFPNPVNTKFFIDFDLAERSEISIRLMDNQGRLVKNFYTGKVKAGPQRFTFDTNALNTGIYYLQIQRPGQSPIVKRILKK